MGCYDLELKSIPTLTSHPAFTTVYLILLKKRFNRNKNIRKRERENSLCSHICMCSSGRRTRSQIRPWSVPWKGHGRWVWRTHSREIQGEARVSRGTLDLRSQIFSKKKLCFSKLVPKMDSDGDGFVEEKELREHINFMQKRCVLDPGYLWNPEFCVWRKFFSYRYVNNDVERTWKNYKEDKIVDGKIKWEDYR